MASSVHEFLFKLILSQMEERIDEPAVHLVKNEKIKSNVNQYHNCHTKCFCLFHHFVNYSLLVNLRNGIQWSLYWAANHFAVVLAT